MLKALPSLDILVVRIPYSLFPLTGIPLSDSMSQFRSWLMRVAEEMPLTESLVVLALSWLLPSRSARPWGAMPFLEVLRLSAVPWA